MSDPSWNCEPPCMGAEAIIVPNARPLELNSDTVIEVVYTQCLKHTFIFIFSFKMVFS